MVPVRIQLLGNAQIHRSDGAPIVLRRRARLLVFFIASQSDALSRERCMSVFWPDDAPDTARQMLRTALHHIKIACGPILVTDLQTIRLHPDVPVDTRLLHHAQPGDAHTDSLLDSAPGNFCAELDSGGIDAIEAWVDSERSRWRRRIADLLLQHSHWLAANSRLQRAVQAVTAAIQYEPLREEISQYAMQLHMRVNNRAAAIACYESLLHALDDQLGVPPLPATTALYHDIVTDRFVLPGEPGQVPSTDPFIGRHAELTILHGQSWDGRVVLLTGAPGIGKTRLAQEYLRRSNAIIVHAVAYAGDEFLPYHVLSRALRTLFAAPRWQELRSHAILPAVWQAELRRLWPELPGGEPDAIPRDGSDSRLPEAIALLLQHVAQEQRIALFLDDAQWLDDASARVFVALKRRSLDASWLICMTLRPGALPAHVQQLLNHADRVGRLTTVTLQPLNMHESTQLAHTHNAQLSEQTIERAEGNPFMVVAFARDSAPSGLELPDAIRALTATRIASLSDDARRLAEAGAVAGRAFEYHLCAQIAHLDEHAAVRACDELVHHGIVRIVGGTHARFDHPLTVESIQASAGPATLNHLNREFATVLSTQQPVDHARVANFFAAAGLIDRALPHADAAAQNAYGLGAWAEAEHYMRMALRAAPSAQHARRWLALGDMLVWSGNESGAADALHQVIEHDESNDGRVADEARLAMARSALPAARYDDAIAIAEPLTNHPDPSIALHAHFICGTAYSLAGVALDAATAYLAAAEARCTEQAAYDVLPRIIFEQGGIAAQQGNLTLAVARYRDAIRAAEEHPHPHTQIWHILAHNNLGYHLLLQGNGADAARHARIALRMSERFGLLRLQSYVFSTMGEIALARADTHAAERHFHEALACAERYAMPERIAGLHANLGLVARAREDTDAATAAFEHALTRADALGVHHLAAQIRIWLASVVDVSQARLLLHDAQIIAQNGGRVRLLAEIATLLANLRDDAPASPPPRSVRSAR